MINSEKHDHDKKDAHEPGRSTVAVFQSRAEAREAIAALHKAHYTHTWLGTTSVAETDGGDEALTVESQQGGFFSHTQSLVDALVSRGVDGDTAREVEDTIEAGEALVTVDPKDKAMTEATALLERHGGFVAGGTSLAARAPRTNAAYQTGSPIDSEWEGETFYRRSSLPRQRGV